MPEPEHDPDPEPLSNPMTLRVNDDPDGSAGLTECCNRTCGAALGPENANYVAVGTPATVREFDHAGTTQIVYTDDSVAHRVMCDYCARKHLQVGGLRGMLRQTYRRLFVEEDAVSLAWFAAALASAFLGGYMVAGGTLP